MEAVPSWHSHEGIYIWYLGYTWDLVFRVCLGCRVSYIGGGGQYPRHDENGGRNRLSQVVGGASVRFILDGILSWCLQ